MKGTSLRTGLEIEIEPFILDLNSPCSTTPSSPTSETDDIMFDIRPREVRPVLKNYHHLVDFRFEEWRV
ncbi:hypothetical protein M3J09_010932 [Ascochyta lentis]